MNRVYSKSKKLSRKPVKKQVKDIVEEPDDDSKYLKKDDRYDKLIQAVNTCHREDKFSDADIATDDYQRDNVPKAFFNKLYSLITQYGYIPMTADKQKVARYYLSFSMGKINSITDDNKARLKEVIEICFSTHKMTIANITEFFSQLKKITVSRKAFYVITAWIRPAYNFGQKFFIEKYIDTLMLLGYDLTGLTDDDRAILLSKIVKIILDETAHCSTMENLVQVSDEILTKFDNIITTDDKESLIAFYEYDNTLSYYTQCSQNMTYVIDILILKYLMSRFKFEPTLPILLNVITHAVTSTPKNIFAIDTLDAIIKTELGKQAISLLKKGGVCIHPLMKRFLEMTNGIGYTDTNKYDDIVDKLRKIPEKMLQLPPQLDDLDQDTQDIIYKCLPYFWVSEHKSWNRVEKKLNCDKETYRYNANRYGKNYPSTYPDCRGKLNKYMTYADRVSDCMIKNNLSTDEYLVAIIDNTLEFHKVLVLTFYLNAKNDIPITQKVFESLTHRLGKFVDSSCHSCESLFNLLVIEALNWKLEITDETMLSYVYFLQGIMIGKSSDKVFNGQKNLTDLMKNHGKIIKKDHVMRYIEERYRLTYQDMSNFGVKVDDEIYSRLFYDWNVNHPKTSKVFSSPKYQLYAMVAGTTKLSSIHAHMKKHKLSYDIICLDKAVRNNKDNTAIVLDILEHITPTNQTLIMCDNSVSKKTVHDTLLKKMK